MPRVEWSSPPSVLGRDCERRAREIPIATGEMMSDLAPRAESDMKANHPWENQTGEAEASLESEHIDEGERHILAFRGTARHIIFLELGTRYMAPRSIIRPTQQAYLPQVRDGMNRIAGA